MSALPDRALMRAVAEVVGTEEKARTAADRELAADLARARERIDDYGNVIENRFLGLEHKMREQIAAQIAALELKDGAAGMPGEPGPAGSPGADGPAGPPGPEGPQGPIGYVGRACGLWNPEGDYAAMDLVAFNGSEWRALRDDPGALPGDGWMLSAQGRKGDKGERGHKGEPGDRGPPGRDGVGIKDIVLDGDGVWRVDPAEVVAHSVPPLDPLVPVARVDDLPSGTRMADAAASVAWRTRGAALTSALQLGVAAGASDLATAYAKERRQFDKPIGQFQAVKHLCADMVSRVEVCRAIVYYAGVCLDDPDVGDGDRAVAAARILAVTASGDNARDCVQVHGGMGYTWEVDAHLFAKRAYVLATAFGAVEEHEEALADLV